MQIQFETFIRGNRYYNHVVSRGEKHAYSFSTSPDKFMSSPHIDKESYHVLLKNKYNSVKDSYQLPPIEICVSIEKKN